METRTEKSKRVRVTSSSPRIVKRSDLVGVERDSISLLVPMIRRIGYRRTGQAQKHHGEESRHCHGLLHRSPPTGTHNAERVSGEVLRSRAPSGLRFESLYGRNADEYMQIGEVRRDGVVAGARLRGTGRPLQMSDASTRAGKKWRRKVKILVWSQPNYMFGFGPKSFYFFEFNPKLTNYTYTV